MERRTWSLASGARLVSSSVTWSGMSTLVLMARLVRVRRTRVSSA